ncbi:Testican-3 [Acipenser ruthenus]|uniref:Testican-3 n=1 Tax=Acipenser ruthenus TaxID=7906 RepID=A0A444V1X5_ACIRT|nr:Testican-3 [Acipenser ruthenus]
MTVPHLDPADLCPPLMTMPHVDPADLCPPLMAMPPVPSRPMPTTDGNATPVPSRLGASMPVPTTDDNAIPGARRPVPTTDGNSIPGPSSSMPTENVGKTCSPTPEYLRPFPKAGPQKSVKVQRSRKLCSDVELREVVNRLRDWFKVLHDNGNQNKKTRIIQRPERSRFDTSILPICKDSLGWMFNRLDTNYDLLLDQSELGSLYLDKNEHCTKSFFNSCDTYRDGLISNNEWCYCFQRQQGKYLQPYFCLMLLLSLVFVYDLSFCVAITL